MDLFDQIEARKAARLAQAAADKANALLRKAEGEKLLRQHTRNIWLSVGAVVASVIGAMIFFRGI